MVVDGIEKAAGSDLGQGDLIHLKAFGELEDLKPYHVGSIRQNGS